MPVTNVPNTATPNAGRVDWNTSDNSLQAEIDADEAALVTHKTSADHDGRYYTETEVDAQQATQDAALQTEIANRVAGDAAAVNLSTDQTVAGTKTFTNDPVIKKTSPAIELHNSDGTKLVRLSGEYTPEPLLSLQAFFSGTWQNVLTFLQGGAVDIPGGALTINGDVVATQEFVLQQGVNQNNTLSGQTAALAVGASGYTQWGSVDQVLAIPSGSIVGVTVYGYGATKRGQWSRTCSVSAQAVKIRINYTNDSSIVVELHDVVGNVLFTGAPHPIPGLGTATFAVTITLL